MKPLFYLLSIIALTPSNVASVAPPPCLGGASLSTFRLLLQRDGKGPALPLSSVNLIEPGEKLKYEPIHIPDVIKDKAQIAILLVPAPTPSSEDGEHGAAELLAALPIAATPSGSVGSKSASATQGTASREENSKSKQRDLVVLEARPAKSPAAWVIPTRASIVGVVFGPHGLDVKKVSSLVEKNEDLIPELADYAQQTATVEALVQTLSQVEQSPAPGTDLNAALRGFSASYALAIPKLDTTAPTNQQATQLLEAVLPSLSSYDPLTSERAAVVAQSTGLASSVAALFFGTPVGLAAGGAALFENLRIMVFPDTDFHSAFTQPVASNGLALCSKDQKLKPRTRPAYLWMLRVPDAAAPKASLAAIESLPLGWKSTVKVACANSSQLKSLGRVRDWELVSSGHAAEIPVTVKLGEPDDDLELDLSHAKLPEGQYRLAAKWDWEPIEVKGEIDLRPFADFSRAKLSPDSEDRLVEGAGLVRIQLTGADFEFVNKVTLLPSSATPGLSLAVLKTSAASDGPAGTAGEAASSVSGMIEAEGWPKGLPFTFPQAKGGGEDTILETEIDTSHLRPGSYVLKLTQTNGSTHDFAMLVHPPNPTLSNFPLRANLGERQQTFALEGTGLERIEGLSCEGATWVLAPVPPDANNLQERKATIKLLPQVKKGETLDASMKVLELHSPLKISDVLRVVGPRPKITGVSESTSQIADVALRQGEIAAGAPASFAIQTENAGSYPTFDLSCAQEADVKKPFSLHPGDRIGSAQLDFAGEGTLFLAVDPGLVGRPGCQLQASLTVEETGASEPYTLGRIIRLPHIEKFTLSDEQAGNHLFSGRLVGQELQAIEKTGWDDKNGYPVQGIPIPDAGEPPIQTLKIELPWPPPSPRAPLYVWLRGETQGRMTQARF